MEATDDGDQWQDVLAEAEHVYVGIATARGPHVTPELFAVVHGRVVCMTAASTVKVKHLRRSPHVALAARGDGRSVSIIGRATVIDPTSPPTVLRSPLSAARAPVEATRFTLANLTELTGAVVDYLTGRLGGPIPEHRVVIAIEPTAVAVVDGTTVQEQWGWDDLDRPGPIGVTARSVGRAADGPDLTALPDELRTLVDGDDVVVGWLGEDGTPRAYVAGWERRSGRARVPADLFRTTAAAARGPASITFDTWTGFGPSGKQGVMLRGTGRAAAADPDMVLSCSLDRAITWEGVVTRSTSL